MLIWAWNYDKHNQVGWLLVSIRYMFDFSEREVEELKSIEKVDVINWFGTYLKQSSPSCRRLAVRVWGCNTNMKDAAPQQSLQIINDVAAFKMSSAFYPSLCWTQKKSWGGSRFGGTFFSVFFLYLSIKNI